ncbi:MAG: NAD-dependent epimerase/dehydratase family protein [Planctomycetaceae bacterium]|nr:NAD-dependent epimerase/dehydratase family protein [Planctomycetaceae bacterium]
MIRDVSHLEALLSEPSNAAVAAMSRIDGDVLILGVGGKMGPSLARMLVRASQQAGIDRKVRAVSRFSKETLRDQLHTDGIETIAGDLGDEAFIAGLPDAANVIFMAGMKFGTGDNPSTTWAMNTYVPALICRRFRDSRILSFSTGNVYPLVPTDSEGSVETDTPGPVGEYAMSALGRERTFEFFCRQDEVPTTIVRLNYAVEMRYGVLVDLAQQVQAEQTIDLSMGYANVIWQADANAMAIAAMADAAVPPYVVNVAGPELVDVRATCERFGELLGKPVKFSGEPASTALLNNGHAGHQRYGVPRVTLDQLIEWTADWIKQGGETHGKATHFQTRDGKF